MISGVNLSTLKGKSNVSKDDQNLSRTRVNKTLGGDERMTAADIKWEENKIKDLKARIKNLEIEMGKLN